MTGFCLYFPAQIYFYVGKSMVLRTKPFIYNYYTTMQISLRRRLNSQVFKKKTPNFVGKDEDWRESAINSPKQNQYGCR